MLTPVDLAGAGQSSADVWTDTLLSVDAQWRKRPEPMASSRLLIPAATSLGIAKILESSWRSPAGPREAALIVDLVAMNILFDGGPEPTGISWGVDFLNWRCHHGLGGGGEESPECLAQRKAEIIVLHERLANALALLADPAAFRMPAHYYATPPKPIHGACWVAWNPADSLIPSEGLAVVIDPVAWSRVREAPLGELFDIERSGLATAFFASCHGESFCQKPRPASNGHERLFASNFNISHHDQVIIPASPAERWVCFASVSRKNFSTPDIERAVEGFFGAGSVFSVEPISKADLPAWLPGIALRHAAAAESRAIDASTPIMGASSRPRSL